MRPPPKPNSCPTRADEILGTGNVAAPSITHSADARTRRYDRLRHPRRSGQELYSLQYIAFVPVNHNMSSGQMDPTPFYKFIYDTNRWVMPTAPLVRIKFSFQILTTNNQPANVARDEQFALGQLTARTARHKAGPSHYLAFNHREQVFRILPPARNPAPRRCRNAPPNHMSASG